jgi:hypothetical protein
MNIQLVRECMSLIMKKYLCNNSRFRRMNNPGANPEISNGLYELFPTQESGN